MRQTAANQTPKHTAQPKQMSKVVQPEYVESDQDVLFILKVNMWEGMSKYIKFKIGNTPEELAYQFCQENQLSSEIYDFICESLRQKLWQFNNGQLVETKSKAIQTKTKQPVKQNLQKENQNTQTLEERKTLLESGTLETSPRDTRDEFIMTMNQKKDTPAPQVKPATELYRKSDFHATSWTVDQKFSSNLKKKTTTFGETQTHTVGGPIAHPQTTKAAGNNAQTADEEPKQLKVKAELRSGTPEYIRSNTVTLIQMCTSDCSTMPNRNRIKVCYSTRRLRWRRLLGEECRLMRRTGRQCHGRSRGSLLQTDCTTRGSRTRRPDCKNACSERQEYQEIQQLKEVQARNEATFAPEIDPVSRASILSVWTS